MVSVTDKKTGASSKESLDAAHWLQMLAADRPAQEFDVIRRACEMAQQAHTGQSRVSGEPFFQHALAVANILVDLKLDHETIAAALLHDVVEDTQVTNAEIERQFSRPLPNLV